MLAIVILVKKRSRCGYKQRYKRDCPRSIVQSSLRGIESRFVNAIEMSGTLEQAQPAADAEREELEWLLTSGTLGRSGNLARVVRYICEERFAGRAHLLKEYTIATEALGRRPGFNPHDDTIVRVTMHSLRKRLHEVYQKEGAARPLHLVVPPGRYEPTFLRATAPPQPAPEPLAQPAADHEPQLPIIEVAVPAAPNTLAAPPVPAEAPHHQPRPHSLLLPAALAVVLLALLAMVAWAVWAHQRSSPTLAKATPQPAIHALLGTNRQPYTDHSGQLWSPGTYCQGESVSASTQKIDGTLDQPLYQGGVRGMAHCLFPVTQKLYEIHFYFAETSDLEAATRVASLSINAGGAFGVDVVDNAGGDRIATSVVVTGVAPENDGSIHVDFVSEISSLDAVEVLPAPSASLLPVRIVMSPRAYTDPQHQLWSADRYFTGGRHGQPSERENHDTLGLYQSDRVGRFRYVIPAVPRAHYRVNLYFREPWFGPGNGGPGSRIFDVAANGQLLLKDFDLLAQPGTEPLVKTFHVQASAGGRIELAFMPQSNYALVNAIEVLPED